MTEPPTAERLWQLTVEHSPVGMTVVSPDGRLTSANRALCAMLGYSSEAELLGTPFQDLTHPDDLAEHVRLYDETLAGKRTSYRLTKRCVRADGSTLWGDLSVALLRDEAGRPVHLIGQINDVTSARADRERLSDAIEVINQQRRAAQAILDTVDIGLLLVDSNGHYEVWNRRHSDFLSLAYPDGHRGESGQAGAVFAADGTTPIDYDDMPSVRAARGEEFDDFRIWIGHDPLAKRALSISARAVRDADGGSVGAALAYTDITDLMQAISSREDFLAAVSHELRTPLTSVLGHLEILVERTDVPDDLALQLRVVQRNAVRLRHLVSDLLDSALQREGALVLTREETDVVGVVQDAVESALPTAAAIGVELVADVTDPVPCVVDRERLRQVVDNLVSNALKYTDAGGRVELTVRAGDEVRIVVSDTGIGIDAAELEKMFTPFYRGQEATARVTPGVGLGLGIARAIVSLHRGRIEVSSTPGEGSVFVVALPR